jgi:hypothetical protein
MWITPVTANAEMKKAIPGYIPAISKYNKASIA